MNSRPILFSAPMVRALLDGRKTQTRRVFKPERMTWDAKGRYTTHAMRGGEVVMTGSGPFLPNDWLHYCPYGQPSDRLWVRETWSDNSATHVPGINQRVYYRADYPEGSYKSVLHWHPSIHMPRWASRITLEITGVRVERLQDISEADAIAEGVSYDPGEGGTYWVPGLGCSSDTATGSYRLLWESINGPGSWGANPWVWLVEFNVKGS